jgi:hypothetical protein
VGSGLKNLVENGAQSAVNRRVIFSAEWSIAFGAYQRQIPSNLHRDNALQIVQRANRVPSRRDKRQEAPPAILASEVKPLLAALLALLWAGTPPWPARPNVRDHPLARLELIRRLSAC